MQGVEHSGETEQEPASCDPAANTDAMQQAERSASCEDNPEVDAGTDAGDEGTEAGDKAGRVAGYMKERVLTIKRPEWDVLIADDCHHLKSITGFTNKLFGQLDREALLLVSATPLSNHVRDAAGYTKLIWNPSWPFRYNSKDPVPCKTFYDPETRLKVKNNESSGGAVGIDRLLGPGIVNPIVPQDLSPRQRIRHDEYIQGVKAGIPMFLLNPELFSSFVKESEFSTDLSTNAIRPILTMLSVKRGMFSLQNLPNGKPTSFSQYMKGLVVETVELELASEQAEVVHEYITGLHDKLISYAEPGLPEILSTGLTVSKTKTMLNQEVYRKLSMVSIDHNNITLPSFIGLEENNNLAFQGLTGTRLLRWYFQQTRPSAKYSCPSGLDLVRWVVWESPKYAYALLKAFEAQDRNQRMLIFVANPLSSQ